MGKFLILIIILIAVYWIFAAKRRPSAKSSGSPASPETMVECAYCRVNLPVSESLAANGRHFCSEEHRRLHHDHLA